VEYLELAGPEGTAVVPLDADRLTIGSEPSNDLVVDDEYASRMHAVVERHPAGWLIRDLGSHNGAHVNGERIAVGRALRPGDTVLVGHTAIEFRSARRPSEGGKSTLSPATWTPACIPGSSAAIGPIPRRRRPGAPRHH